jgi:hypothetical protein
MTTQTNENDTDWPDPWPEIIAQRTTVPTSVQFSLIAIGEEYRALAVISYRTLNTSLNSLLQGYIRQALDLNRDRIMRRVAYSARRRGISVDEMWDRILAGKYNPEMDLENYKESDSEED